ncbi:MAG: hypothetical protein FRX49_09448 [Trebouxia sp. A1-2]|nr:MAG: hypothetical protein FRX49_09448 [Trebouxia sp. A1-2]
MATNTRQVEVGWGGVWWGGQEWGGVTCDLVMPPLRLRSMSGETGRPSTLSWWPTHREEHVVGVV